MGSIEDRNYWNDPRVAFRDPRHAGWRVDERHGVVMVERTDREEDCDECCDLQAQCPVHQARVETPEACEERQEAEREGQRLIAAPYEVAIPFRWEVCGLCSGRGKVVNPSIDCGGLTSDDFDADPDFAESYMRGDYDQQCPEYRGRSTVPVLNPQTAEQKAVVAELDKAEAADAAYERECRAERAMGA